MSVYPASIPSSLATLATPLPPAPDGEVLTPSQWASLLSICDAFLSPVSGIDETVHDIRPYSTDSTSTTTIRDYLSETTATIPGFKDALHRRLASLPKDEKDDLKGLAFILNTLNTRVGCLLLTSSSTTFHQQDLKTRLVILKSWSNSRLSLLPGLVSSLGLLARQTWALVSPTFSEVIGFPSTPEHVERNESFKFSFKDFSDCPKDKPVTIETDIVIVGSGCGAGVAALHLSTAGYKVLVVEKSYHFPSTHFPMNASTAPAHIFDTDADPVTIDQSMAVLAGSTWGGGGTVNWSASLQPQHFVREEWAKDGLTFATSAEFQDCLDTVCDHMGVARANDVEALTKIEHNFANKTLLEGARKLGLTGEIVPQNTAGKRHHCGYCGEGCASATKQGPANYWLPKAAEKGAEFIEGCWIEEILFDNEGSEDGNTTNTTSTTASTSPLTSFFTSLPTYSTGSSSPPAPRATGIKAQWTSRSRDTTIPVIIHAKHAVILSAGTLNTPSILQRSSQNLPPSNPVRRNQNIGANLHLHPTSAVLAVWPERANPWAGGILTAAVTSLENQDGAHHGPKLECLASTPGYAIPWLPFHINAAQSPSEASICDPATTFKLTASKFGHMSCYISLQRDRDTGKVVLDSSDSTRRRIRINYSISERDRAGVLAGVIALARILYVQGAKEIHVVVPDVLPFVRNARLDDDDEQSDDEDRFSKWLSQVEASHLKSSLFGSAHQMSTCRMSTSPSDGVVDQAGKVHGVNGLYICDASVLRSASGVNPMVSTMGLSEWICRGLVRTLGKKGVNGSALST